MMLSLLLYMHLHTLSNIHSRVVPADKIISSFSSLHGKNVQTEGKNQSTYSSTAILHSNV